MIYDFHPIFGILEGALHTTPEEALELFNFKMKPNATGIYFYTRKGKHIIANLVPPGDPKTKPQLQVRNRLSLVSLIARHTRPLINEFWNPIAMKKGRYGDNLFHGENLSRIGLPPDWTKLIFTPPFPLCTKPKLLPPTILQAIYSRKLLNIKTSFSLKLKHSPLGRSGPLTQPDLKHSPLGRSGPLTQPDFSIPDKKADLSGDATLYIAAFEPKRKLFLSRSSPNTVGADSICDNTTFFHSKQNFTPPLFVYAFIKKDNLYSNTVSAIANHG